MAYFVYILQSEVKETYYIGASGDPHKRCFYHNNSSKGYTLRFRPCQLVFTHKFETKKEALAAEQKIKSWKSKKMIKLLILDRINIENYL